MSQLTLPDIPLDAEALATVAEITLSAPGAPIWIRVVSDTRDARGRCYALLHWGGDAASPAALMVIGQGSDWVAAVEDALRQMDTLGSGLASLVGCSAGRLYGGLGHA